MGGLGEPEDHFLNFHGRLIIIKTQEFLSFQEEEHDG